MTIFVGITGAPGSGKEETKNALTQILEQNGITFYYWSISKDIRSEIGHENYTRKDVSLLSSTLKERFGENVLAVRAVNGLKVVVEGEAPPSIVLIESIKNSHEVDYFRKIYGSDFILLGISVNSIEIIASRIASRNRYDEDPEVLSNSEEAKKLIESELGLDKSSQVFDINRCLEISDYVIDNSSDLEHLRNEVRLFFESVVTSRL